MALTLFAQSGKQREYKKKLQFSVFPGISTNGIQSGFYINNFSFNLFGGLSGFNRFLEIGLITNSNIHGTTGIQLAGMANIIGTNAFLNMTQTDEWKMINDGYESNTQGIQTAGLLNYVRTHVTGIQVAGALNVVGRDFNGVQVAGLGNSSAGYAIGFQGAGFYNIAHQFMMGVQITTLFNYTDGQLSGTQLALVNKAKQTMGKNSTPFALARSLQLGLLNFSKAMHGTQVGLINFGGETRGNQFGLINFFNRNKTKENVDAGVPIGLLNIGSRGSVFRVTTNDLFLTNIEYTTGNCQNCSWTPAGPVGMPYEDNNKKFNQSALILGFDHVQNTWGFGWGFMKILRNKHSMLPIDKLNERRMLSYGARFLHLNRNRELDRQFNLLSRLHVELGRKWKSRYVFAGLAFNYLLQRVDADPYTARSIVLNAGRVGNKSGSVWPGYTLGIQM
ncbi:MAG: hypothetical protein ACOYXA_02850 [Bacteroidota bacterium]